MLFPGSAVGCRLRSRSRFACFCTILDSRSWSSGGGRDCDRQKSPAFWPPGERLAGPRVAKDGCSFI
ncbi:Hypothetical predicted protein [Marmota monax]|uniref:Uncharacterized protein n=1 Tax=Marmota monax TaxID=9995 RepID=A0A5E4APC6_MARMO|nr:hypothetical protein GHT09_015216 [Marmota monax]VTJ58626.1 Hypothetical predicted protein [Marmota monax]